METGLPKFAGVVLAAAALSLIPLSATGQRRDGRRDSKKAGPFSRLADGKPNMQGYWETRNFFTAFDLETHEKAAFGVPAGHGVVVDPPNSKIPYQPWALEKKKDILEHHLFDDPQAHCWLSGVPRQMYTPFGFQILQPPGYVVLLYEAFHSYRIIPLDGLPHASAAIHTMTDLNTIQYEATLEDPKVFTQPWKIAFELGRNREPDYEQMEYACVEGEKDLEHYTESEGARRK